ncbi:MAG TPA: hypothetical protein VIE65_07690, partial [Methylobacter sp.]
SLLLPGYRVPSPINDQISEEQNPKFSPKFLLCQLITKGLINLEDGLKSLRDIVSASLRIFDPIGKFCFTNLYVSFAKFCQMASCAMKKSIRPTLSSPCSDSSVKAISTMHS